MRPTPRISIKCLGHSGVLIGQNLLPMPPAMMTRYLLDVAISDWGFDYTIVFEALSVVTNVYCKIDKLFDSWMLITCQPFNLQCDFQGECLVPKIFWEGHCYLVILNRTG